MAAPAGAGGATDPRLAAFLQVMLGGARGGGSSNEELIEALKSPNGPLESTAIVDAMLKLPRGAFVPEAQADEAYFDAPLRIPGLQFNISAPHMYAVALEALQLEPGHDFLDVGSGCGFLTALGGLLVGEAGCAVGWDLRPDIVAFSQHNVEAAAESAEVDLSNTSFAVQNCFLPTVEEKKFDRIHVGACIPDAQRPALTRLLKPGGVLVGPYGDHFVKMTKSQDSEDVEITEMMDVRYSDLIVPSDTEVRAAAARIERERTARIVVPPDNLGECFLELLSQPQTADCVLNVAGTKIPAHKSILAARSEYFAALFFHGFGESTSSNTSDGATASSLSAESASSSSANREVILDIEDASGHHVSPTIFRLVLRYMYGGDAAISNVLPDDAVEMLAVCNQLKLDRLTAVCEKMIQPAVDEESAAYILRVAVLYNAWQLRIYTADYVVSHFSSVSQTAQFVELPKDVLVEITKRACDLLTRQEG